MLGFRDFLEERKVDPVALANRASRMYGKKTSYGKWDKAEKHGHIPLKYDGRAAAAASNRLYHLQKKHDFFHPDKERNAEGKRQFKAKYKPATMKISDLHATQHFVRTNDQQKLHDKVKEKNPGHIVVVTHKGKHFIADGHHSVMAARLRGDTHVPVHHLDMDSEK